MDLFRSDPTAAWHPKQVDTPSTLNREQKLHLNVPIGCLSHMAPEKTWHWPSQGGVCPAVGPCFLRIKPFLLSFRWFRIQ